MDNLNDAFDSLGIETEELGDTQNKLSEEAEENGFHVNQTHYKETKSQKLFYGLTSVDRDFAVKMFVVPAAFRDASFDIEKIRENIKVQYQRSKMYKIYKFSSYTNICEQILSTIRMRNLPQCSYLIGAPNGFGKTSFVSECLMTLLKQGYKVAPYISLLELAQVRVDNEQRMMKPFARFREEDGRTIYTESNKPVAYCKSPEIISGRYSYSEYINADCLFVHFTDVVSKDIESHTLYQLLNIRGAKGLPTIVMMSTSLLPYESDNDLREQVWNEIRAYSENKNCYDRVYHISTYKLKSLGLNNKNEDVDSDTGIVMQE